jgi:hypothetical protein
MPEQDVFTVCNNCVWAKTCGKDAKDPDCYPYGLGCEEYTSQRMLDMADKKKGYRYG